MMYKMCEMREFILKGGGGSFAYAINGSGAYWKIGNGTFSTGYVTPISQRSEIIKQGLGYLHISGKKLLTMKDISKESYTGNFKTDKGIPFTMVCTPVGEKSTNLKILVNGQIIHNKKVTITFQSLKSLESESEKIVLNFSQRANPRPVGDSQVSTDAQPMQNNRDINTSQQMQNSQPVRESQSVKKDNPAGVDCMQKMKLPQPKQSNQSMGDIFGKSFRKEYNSQISMLMGDDGRKKIEIAKSLIPAKYRKDFQEGVDVLYIKDKPDVHGSPMMDTTRK